MPRAQKTGAGIGRIDANGEQLRVGDYVISSTGVPYQINRYGNLMNEVVGCVNFKTVDGLILGSEGHYKQWVKKHREPEPESKEEVINLDDIPDAPVPQWNDATVDEVEEESEQEIKMDDNAKRMTISCFTDEDLFDEIRNRGYAGTLRKPVVTYNEVTI